MTGTVPLDPTQRLADALLGDANVEEVLEAIRCGADVHRFDGPEGDAAPLSWAVNDRLGPDGSLQIVQTLLAAGALVSEERPPDGVTSVHRAAELGYVNVIHTLLAADGKVALNSFDYISRTPLICAAHRGQLAAAQLLIEAGSELNAHDERRIGNPALRWAVEAKNEAMVRLLLKAGADPLIPGWMQLSALDEAASWKESRKPHLRKIHDLLESVARNPSVRRSLK